MKNLIASSEDDLSHENRVVFKHQFLLKSVIKRKITTLDDQSSEEANGMI